MSFLKNIPFKIIAYSDFYQQNLIHVIQMLRYNPQSGKIYYAAYCEKDIEVYGEPSYEQYACDSMQWIDMCNNAINPD